MFVNSIIDSSITDTSEYMTGLSAILYWWRVKANINSSWGGLSSHRKFIFIPGSVQNGKSLTCNLFLYQNHPIPSNPATFIKYDIPQTSHVQLTVFSIFVRGMAVLANKEKVPGFYEVTLITEGMT